jgi:hypothetical protein
VTALNTLAVTQCGDEGPATTCRSAKRDTHTCTGASEWSHATTQNRQHLRSGMALSTAAEWAHFRWAHTAQ